MFLFERYGHGMGMMYGLYTSSVWPIRAEEWWRKRGLLNAVKQ